MSTSQAKKKSNMALRPQTLAIRALKVYTTFLIYLLDLCARKLFLYVEDKPASVAQRARAVGTAVQ